MRSRNTRCALPLLSALLLSSCAGQSQAPAVDAAAMTAALDSLNKAFSAAVAARDTDAVAAFYSPDAHVLAAGMPRADGHDAIRATWVACLRTPGLDLHITSGTPIITQAGDFNSDKAPPGA